MSLQENLEVELQELDSNGNPTVAEVDEGDFPSLGTRLSGENVCPPYLVTNFIDAVG